ncbi:germ-plasm component protein maelstrom [Lycorma delicatula]|uniref:germ-plasm component protein maelstrom n=1 Tax=Lycorma delicatula TaxID=130591 RepID=UPI003F5137E6
MGPKKKKQPPRNGYYFLMLEHRRQEEERGRNITMKQASDEVKELWAGMAKTEKDYYNKMADEHKRLQNEEKYNTLGMSFSELGKMQLERERDKRIMDEIIRDTIRHLDKNTTLRTKVFHVIHINYYCETDTRHFIPAEIAIAKFNLEDGIIDTLHRYVSPGNLPLGYRFIATEHINNTHKTPIDWDKGETDMNKLFNSIKSFIKPEGMTGELPPLYTMPENVNTNSSDKAVKGVLKELCENHGEEPDLFRVYMLGKLFYELRNACNSDGKNMFPTQSIAESELEKDVFNYTRGIACKFHEDEDVVQFCSLSTVQAWIFLICDHCCHDLNINMRPGFHCPKSADVHGKYRTAWRSRKNSTKFYENQDVASSSSAASSIHQKVVDGFSELKLREPYKNTVSKGLLRAAPPGFDDFNSGETGGYVCAEEPKISGNVDPPERSPANCWSSITERSKLTTTLPPALNEDNYPSISGGRGISSGSTAQFNAWSGRGRSVRGRGLTASMKDFYQID